MSKQGKGKEYVTLVCSRCGNELTASPGMAKYALEGKGVCVKCEGQYVNPESECSDKP